MMEPEDQNFAEYGDHLQERDLQQQIHQNRWNMRMEDDELLEMEAIQMEYENAKENPEDVNTDDEVWICSEPETDSDEELNEHQTEMHDTDDGEIENVVQMNVLGKTKNTQTESQRTRLAQRLLALSHNWFLRRGALKTCQAEFNLSRSTVSRMWKSIKDQGINNLQVINVSSKKIGKVGRKARNFDTEILVAISQDVRTTIRSFAVALECSPSMVYRLLKKGIIRSHTNSIKPTVTEAHKLQRLRWILGLTLPKTPTQQSRFMSLHNIVHIDEKWFFMSKKTQRYYLLANEEEPYRHIQSVNHMEKVMFLSGVSHPHIGQFGEVHFDGKMGIFAFTEQVATVRSSKNRERGTMITKAVTSITKPIIRKMIIEELLPAIRSKWPPNACKMIWIQQDNARPHMLPNDEEFLQAANLDGFEMQLICQPAQSPDLNILDLGFFRAIQSIQHQKFPKNVDSLVKSVQDAYAEYDPRSLNYNWLQLQYVMVEILKQKGGNRYKSPHTGKKRLESQGLLPTDVEISDTLLDETVAYLNENIINVPGPEDAYYDM